MFELPGAQGNGPQRGLVLQLFFPRGPMMCTQKYLFRTRHFSPSVSSPHLSLFCVGPLGDAQGPVGCLAWKSGPCLWEACVHLPRPPLPHSHLAPFPSTPFTSRTYERGQVLLADALVILETELGPLASAPRSGDETTREDPGLPLALLPRTGLWPSLPARARRDSTGDLSFFAGHPPLPSHFPPDGLAWTTFREREFLGGGKNSDLCCNELASPEVDSNLTLNPYLQEANGKLKRHRRRERLFRDSGKENSHSLVLLAGSQVGLCSWGLHC